MASNSIGENTLTGNSKFCKDTGKTLGILFAQIVNSLILKIKDITIFASEVFKYFLGN